uniref:Uncharacterized protein n=1 Tax=Lepeophtheirus salmonis TaxID=72036 RepID=A0A0K2TLL2_LEPSM
MTMYTRAIDFRTTRILESLEAAPPVTLETLKAPNSVLRAWSCFVSSSFFFKRSSEHLILTCNNYHLRGLHGYSGINIKIRYFTMVMF